MVQLTFVLTQQFHLLLDGFIFLGDDSIGLSQRLHSLVVDLIMTCILLVVFAMYSLMTVSMDLASVCGDCIYYLRK